MRSPRNRILAGAGAAVLGGAVLFAGIGGQGGDANAAQKSPAPVVQQAVAPSATAAPQVQAAAAKTPVQIFKASRKKAKGAKTVRVQATFEDKGGDVKVDLRMTQAGKATGTISTPADGSMKLILVSKKKGYFKPGKKMLNEIAGGDKAVKERLAGRWFAFKKGDGLDDAFALGSMKTYTQDIFVLSGKQSGLTKVKGAKVKGYKKTVGLKEKGYPGTLLIAADGTYRLAGYRDPESRVTYSAWNKKVTVKAPKKTLKAADFS
ncbi:hypothetical protein [Kineosporia babensis]|uniref:Lipoprotein n=1 Tax=Kineosporia babensis TaxID=499548 RepID=A0A9X1NCC6_9ACTN|nr:hypothetical protein [Kineosporia babensis]MCD5310671.1 hypothetical protein [Kineosporia babensis]